MFPHKYINVLVLTLGICSLSVASDGHAENDNKLYTKDKSCALAVDPGNITHMTWTGSCVNGYVTGEGRIDLFNDDEKLYWYNVGPETGIQFEDGNEIIAVDGNIVKIELSQNWRNGECKPQRADGRPGGRQHISIYVYATPQTEIEIWGVRSAIYKKALDTIIDKCSYFRKFRHKVHIARYADDLLQEKDEFGSGGYGEFDKDGNLIQEVNLHSLRARRNDIKNYNRQIALAKQREQRKRQEAEKAEEERLAKLRMVNLTDEYGAIGWLRDHDAIGANPYAFIGKRVLIEARFDKMLRRDTALLSTLPFVPIVIAIDTPSNAFINRRSLVLVGEVVDQDEYRGQYGNPFTETLFVKYIDHAWCKNNNCTDYK